MLAELVNYESGEVTWMLIDRMYKMRMVSPNPDNGKFLHQGQTVNTSNLVIRNLFDGELVQDEPWRHKSVCLAENQVKPIFLVFDALVVNLVNVMVYPFRTRLVDADSYLKKRFMAARLT